MSKTWCNVTNENLLWKHLVTKKWERYSDKVLDLSPIDLKAFLTPLDSYLQILNDRSNINEDMKERDWKQYLRWCESKVTRPDSAISDCITVNLTITRTYGGQVTWTTLLTVLNRRGRLQWVENCWRGVIRAVRPEMMLLS